MPYTQVGPFLKHLNIYVLPYLIKLQIVKIWWHGMITIPNLRRMRVAVFMPRAEERITKNKVHFSRHHKPVIQILCEGPFLI